VELGRAMEEKEKKSEEQETTLQVIKVPQARIDKLMNLIGELMIKKNNFNVLAKEVLVDYGLSNVAEKIKNAGLQVSRISDELQATIMSVRMVPLSIVFSRFPRLVRDLAKKLGKKIKIDVKGEETELDKTLVEIIGDPLVHIIRNSIDHGIEMPLDRISNGKQDQGFIKIKAYNEGQNVIIEIQDDGKGIDPEKVSKRALEKGIIDKEKHENMTDLQKQMLIFAPGFSTAEQVTDLSGRGVGMDVVKSNIEKISGTVTVDSVVGKGTTLKLKLPLTLAINRGIEIGVDNNRFFLSVENIIETVKLMKDNLIRHKNSFLVMVRGEVLPLISLSKILGLEDEYQEELSLLIIKVKGRKIALKVDKVHGEEEYLIKSLPEALKKIGFFSGAVITGEGSVKLVLDPIRFF